MTIPRVQFVQNNSQRQLPCSPADELSDVVAARSPSRLRLWFWLNNCTVLVLQPLLPCVSFLCRHDVPSTGTLEPLCNVTHASLTRAPSPFGKLNRKLQNLQSSTSLRQIACLHYYRKRLQDCRLYHRIISSHSKKTPCASTPDATRILQPIHWPIRGCPSCTADSALNARIISACGQYATRFDCRLHIHRLAWSASFAGPVSAYARTHSLPYPGAPPIERHYQPLWLPQARLGDLHRSRSRVRQNLRRIGVPHSRRRSPRPEDLLLSRWSLP